MKKQLLLVVGLGLFLGGYQLVDAEESQPIDSSQQESQTSSSEQVSIEESSETVQSSPPLQQGRTATTSETETLVTGTYGTVPWTFDTTTQVLSFGGGAFPEVNYTDEKTSCNNIKDVIETSALNAKKIKKIIFTDEVVLDKHSSGLFANLSVESITGTAYLNTANVQEMHHLFYQTPNLTTVDVSQWKTSNVTDMSFVFAKASKLQVVDVSRWDTAKVTNLSSMFEAASSLVSIGVSQWNTSSVTNMSGLFADATKLVNIPVGQWDTSQVTDMSRLFYNTKKLTRIDISNWDTSKVDNMSAMFSSATGLTSIDVSQWDTSNVTTMSSMFSNATGLTSIDVSQWDTSNVTTMSAMFSSATGLTSLDVSQWDTSNVTTMSSMFSNAYKLTSLDVSNWDTSKVTTMSYMFSYATGLTSLDVSQWDTSNVTTMYSMFYCTVSLTSLDVSNWDTSSVTTMSSMFSSATGLTSLDVSNWDTSNVTTMYSMFSSATKLSYLDLSSWNFVNVANTSYMFGNTDSLDVLVLGPQVYFTTNSLPEKTSSPYTGAWVSATGTKKYDSSQEFMTNYDGSYPGKYLREKKIPVTGIQLLPSALALQINEEKSLEVVVTPAEAINQKVQFQVVDSTIATVSTEGLVKGLRSGVTTITATTEDGAFSATTTVTVLKKQQITTNEFYLGVDSYVTGRVPTDIGAKKAKLLVNGTVISEGTITKTGSFELATNNQITAETDQVEVQVLDRKQVILDQATVTTIRKNYSLQVNPFVLYENTTLTGTTDAFHTEVALVVNGEEVARQLVTLTHDFSFETGEWIEYDDDEVAIVGYRYKEEVTRTSVPVQVSTVEVTLQPLKVGDVYLNGTVKSTTASFVRLYVNGRRQTDTLLAETGAFQCSSLAIASPLDNVELGIYNQAGIEIDRVVVPVSW